MSRSGPKSGCCRPQNTLRKDADVYPTARTRRRCYVSRHFRFATVLIASIVASMIGCQTSPQTINDTSTLDVEPTIEGDAVAAVDAGDASTTVADSNPSPLLDEAPSSMTAFMRRTSMIGYSTEGRPIECIAMGDGPTAVLILATIHGDESAGTPLVNRMLDEIALDQRVIEGRTLWVVPVVNPDGMRANLRENARGVDLNRNFPAENFVPSAEHGRRILSEPEAEAIARLIVDIRPRHILSFHQPLNCLDFDGPAGGLALAMSEVCDLPIRKLGTRPGSLGAYTGETLQIPTITIELPRSADGLRVDELWRDYGEMLMVAIAYDGE